MMSKQNGNKMTPEEQKIFNSVLNSSNKDAKFEELDSVQKAMLGNWNDQRVLDELHEDYLIAKQSGVESAIDGHKWNVTDTFDRWLHDAEKVLIGRKQELKEKYDQKIPIYPKLVKHLESGELTGAHQDVGRTLTRQDYEFYDMIFHKTLEVIKKYWQGVLKPTESLQAIKEMNPDSDIDELLDLEKKPSKIIIP